MKYFVNFFSIMCLFMCLAQSAGAQKDHFKDLPDECSPQKVGAILGQRFFLPNICCMEANGFIMQRSVPGMEH